MPSSHDTEIRVRPSRLGIDLKDLAKIALRFFQSPLGESVLAPLKQLRGIPGLCVPRRSQGSAIAPICGGRRPALLQRDGHRRPCQQDQN
jgi:hypothetical protein